MRFRIENVEYKKMVMDREYWMSILILISVCLH